jgi:hypothetical protein
VYASAATGTLDNDDAGFRQEKAANRVFAYVPEGRELGDREVPFEVARIVLRTHTHRAKAPVSNYRLKCCDPCFFSRAQLIYSSRSHGR